MEKRARCWFFCPKRAFANFFLCGLLNFEALIKEGLKKLQRNYETNMAAYILWYIFTHTSLPQDKESLERWGLRSRHPFSLVFLYLLPLYLLHRVCFSRVRKILFFFFINFILFGILYSYGFQICCLWVWERWRERNREPPP